jgi:pantoate--beta-alanine ligase
MQIAETPQAMRSLSDSWRVAGQKVGFVPTMGALHEGHLALIRTARSECDRLVVSIFVNPTQFGAGEDFDTYPRRVERDRWLLQETGCDALFAPAVETVYGGRSTDLGSGERTFVEVGKLGELWEGASRPGHFRGVATVVAILFNIVRPQRAYFGEKDYQQFKIIEGMARDLHFDVEIVPCPTIRERDGLAMSSRNAYLSPEERKAATVLSQALNAAVRLTEQGERDAERLAGRIREVCDAEPLISLRYAAVVDAETLSPLKSLGDRPARALIAAHVGCTHLIDNVEMPAPSS